MDHIKLFKSINTYVYIKTLIRRRKNHNLFENQMVPYLKNLNALHQGCQVWLKLAKWLWRRFLNAVNVFLVLLNYLPLVKGCGHSFEQYQIPFTQGCFVPRLIEIDTVVLEKEIFKYFQYNYIFTFTLSMYFRFFHLEKGGTPHLNKLESPSPEEALC